MRPLRFSINVTLDGCCDHRVGIPNEGVHRRAAEHIAFADALNDRRLPGMRFRPAFFYVHFGPYAGQRCAGVVGIYAEPYI